MELAWVMCVTGAAWYWYGFVGAYSPSRGLLGTYAPGSSPLLIKSSARTHRVLALPHGITEFLFVVLQLICDR